MSNRLLQGHGKWVVIVVACVSSYVTALVYFWPVIGLQSVADGQTEFKITESERAAILNSFLVSKIVSIFASSYVMDRFGRKMAMTCFSAVAVLGGLMIYFATSAVWLSVGRVLQGFYVSVQMSVLPAIIGETIEADTRGAVSAVCCLISCASNVISSLLSNVTYDWYNFVIGFPSIILLIGCFMLPETPYYHLRRGKIEETKKSIEWLRGSCSDDDIACMELYLKSSQNVGKISILFQRQSRKAFMMLLPLVVFITGGTCEVFFNYFFVILEPSPVLPSIALTITQTVEIAAALISILTIDRIGRRPVAFLSFLGLSLSYLALAIWFYLENTSGQAWSNVFTVTALTLAAFFQIMGLESMPRILLSELFCLEVKGTASVVVTIIKALITIVLNQTFFPMKNDYGLWLYFLVGFVSTALGAVFVMVGMVETKGQALEEIQETLKK